jgi:hypothetical protein
LLKAVDNLLAQETRKAIMAPKSNMSKEQAF